MVWNKIKRKFKYYLRDDTGVAAFIFALVLPVLVASGGLAVDLAKAQNVKNRLANALDKAALAAANTTGDQATLETTMERFFQANFPEAKLGTPYDLALNVDGNTLSVSASARVETSFMQIWGKDYVEVSASSEVVRQLSGIEVALVLDVTGSMAGTNISALRTASTDFINIMFDAIAQPEYIKVGIVPYSSSVNVGPYGVGENIDGSSYGTGFVVQPDADDFLTPSTIEYNPGSSLQWHGCVLARDYPLDAQDTGPNEWQMYRYPEQCRYYRYGRCRSYRRDPNYNCPATPIVPLTSSQSELLNTINALQAQGYTYGNIGMAWGGRIVSPDYPFTEGAAWDDNEWEKAILMMTDGRNTMHNFYSVYGRTADHNITPSDLNARFEEVCEELKNNGVKIYTVTFQSSIDDTTRDYYRRCATTSSMYFHAPSSNELIEVFRNIANQLSKLHISK